MNQFQNKLGIFVALTLLLMYAGVASAQYQSFSFDGYERTYLVHLPANYAGDTELPLVIAMHGGFGSAENLQNQSQLSVKADAENFIVVYPEGVKGGILNIRTWNAGWCCGFASNSDVDDVGFINALLDTLANRYSIDANRIYATGMSNGGFMAYRLACELSDRIAAIAPVSASMSVTGYIPTRPVPVIHFHSFADTSVPYNGGIGEGVSDHYNPPIDSVLNAWASIDNCQRLNDTIIANEQYTFVSWNNCDCRAEVQLYITEDGGHSWPGGQQTVIGDPVSNYINANDLMWNFFEQHSRNCIPTLVTELPKNINDQVKLFPNPTNGMVTIQIPTQTSIISIGAFNLSGKLIQQIYRNNSVDLSCQPSGIYLISIQTEDGISTRKIIRKE